MKIHIGDVFVMETGEGLRIEKYDYPGGEFEAQVRSVETKEWTEFRITGAAIKLPMFLKQQQAKLEKELG